MLVIAAMVVGAALMAYQSLPVAKALTERVLALVWDTSGAEDANTNGPVVLLIGIVVVVTVVGAVLAIFTNVFKTIGSDVSTAVNNAFTGL